MRILGLVGALFMLLTLPGCPGLDGCGGGQVNALDFSYSGCGTDGHDCHVAANRLAAGTSAHIDVAFDSYAGTLARVQSSNPSVATFVGHPPVADVLGIDVSALAPGTTELQLIDLHDGVAGSVTVTVAAAVGFAFTLGSPAPDGSIAVLVPSKSTLELAPQDAAGAPLFGTFPLTISGASNAVALQSSGVYSLSVNDAEPAVVSAALPGGVTFQLAVRPDHVGDLVSAAAVAAASFPDAADGSFVDVTVTPVDASGPVYGADCVWSVADSDVVIEPQVTNALALVAGELTRFHLRATTDTTATCQIGALSTTVALHR